MKPTLILLTFGALLVALAPGASAQSDQRIVVPLSEPGRPATLEVSLIWGSIAVSAYDGDEVIIVAREGTDEPPRGADESGLRRIRDLLRDDSRDAGPRGADETGLRRIPNTSIGLIAEERNNTVSIAVDWTNRNIQLDISVPQRTSVRASTVRGGELTVEGVAGEHELSNVNGGISATDVAGSVVAGTTNGDMLISFRELTANKAMSFTSFNGDVAVTFPPSLAADLRISAGRGDVLTDFDVEVQPSSPVVERSGDAASYRVRLTSEVHAVVGGGGADMHFKTMNGNIIIRQR